MAGPVAREGMCRERSPLPRTIATSRGDGNRDGPRDSKPGDGRRWDRTDETGQAVAHGDTAAPNPEEKPFQLDRPFQERTHRPAQPASACRAEARWDLRLARVGREDRSRLRQARIDPDHCPQMRHHRQPAGSVRGWQEPGFAPPIRDVLREARATLVRVCDLAGRGCHRVPQPGRRDVPLGRLIACRGLLRGDPDGLVAGDAVAPWPRASAARRSPRSPRNGSARPRSRRPLEGREAPPHRMRARHGL